MGYGKRSNPGNGEGEIRFCINAAGIKFFFGQLKRDLYKISQTKRGHNGKRCLISESGKKCEKGNAFGFCQTAGAAFAKHQHTKHSLKNLCGTAHPGRSLFDIQFLLVVSVDCIAELKHFDYWLRFESRGKWYGLLSLSCC